MKEYLAKKYIFAVVFVVAVYVLAITNMVFSFDELKDSVKDVVKENEVTDLDSFFETSNGIAKALDGAMTDNVYGKYNYLETYGLYSKILGKDEYNGFSIVKDNNGYMFYGNLWNFNLDENTNTGEFAKRVYNMKQKLEESGTKVYVLSMPVKSMSEHLDFDEGIPYQDYSSVADGYIYWCQAFNLDVIDFRKMLKKQDMSYDEMFFRTDHHWTPLAAFYGYTYLLEELKADGYDLDKEGKFSDIENYTMETYEECWLGTYGINTGAVYSGQMESISILTPKFETNFYYKYRYSGDIYFVEEEGSFDETLLDREHIYEQVEGNLYEGSAYNAYLNGVCAYDHIENKNNPDGPKVLFIRDSYSSPLGAFFASVCSEVDMIWAKEYEDSIEELVENGDYDFVFVATWPDNLAEDSFNFYKED